MSQRIAPAPADPRRWGATRRRPSGRRWPPCRPPSPRCGCRRCPWQRSDDVVDLGLPGLVLRDRDQRRSGAATGARRSVPARRRRSAARSGSCSRGRPLRRPNPPASGCPAPRCRTRWSDRSLRRSRQPSRAGRGWRTSPPCSARRSRRGSSRRSSAGGSRRRCGRRRPEPAWRPSSSCGARWWSCDAPWSTGRSLGLRGSGSGAAVGRRAEDLLGQLTDVTDGRRAARGRGGLPRAAGHQRYCGQREEGGSPAHPPH